MTKTLFDSFDPISSKQWKQKIQFELNGADYNQTLLWESAEGIKVKPFYHRDEKSNSLPISNPKTPFQIGQPIFVFDVAKSIQKANDALKRGAESLYFTIPKSDCNIQELLGAIAIEKKNIFFHLKFLSIDFVTQLEKIAIEKKAEFYINLDPIGNLAREGNWFATQNRNNFEELELLAQKNKFINLISVDGTLYQNAGANMVQQIAYCLSHSIEYLNSVPSYQKTIVFEMAVGGNYFFEIAKLRALRFLFEGIAAEFQPELKCHIVGVPSKRNKTVYDFNVNLLRTTTECMSAILGGADTIINLPYDEIYHKRNEFADRIARNQLLILKNESDVNAISNPVEGSYYIESITTQLAEKALLLCKEIEQKGGFLKQLKLGSIQTKIQESAAKEQNLFDSQKEIAVGTNQFINASDRMKETITLLPFVKIKPRKTIITPIIEKRLAEKQEQQRLNTEK
ncbi:methylmalonyl-CoA mutase subunit beta [Flavobacterium agrisoli]|uniref:Methylmalonyl-CoA mutase subunit beta n=1 Tax=Flavobacterium agrisoli TaxID=2793066 RepID=A0A934PKR8_9FLAO|nr:methylmalonyl-CoA mutase subunit beta [Flavobacterium agrisoli]MBK0369971.1 methylmalonyl-CoA mutase subunit beta [Flavobacterium agrisoli]